MAKCLRTSGSVISTRAAEVEPVMTILAVWPFADTSTGSSTTSRVAHLHTFFMRPSSIHDYAPATMPGIIVNNCVNKGNRCIYTAMASTLPYLTTDQVRAFVELSRHGQIRAAARVLNITEQGVRNRLLTLEAQLGV